MSEEITIEECRSLTKLAGLDLCDEELGRLLAGINRARRQAAELRHLIDADAEPAFAIKTARPAEK